MDSQQMVKQYQEMLSNVGGASMALNRLLEAKLFYELYSRTKIGEERVELEPKITIEGKNFRPDIYTETGIARLRIPPHSFFEIKTTLIFDTVYRFHEVVNRLKQFVPDAKFYLIFGNIGSFNDKALQKFKKDKHFEIYQIDDYIQKIEKVKALNDQLENFERDWRQSRDNAIEGARFSFRENNCSLFLGAGVSISAGGPSWKELLFKAIKSQNKSFAKRDFNKIFDSCGQSPIVMGRYVAPDKYRLEKLSGYLQKHVLYKDVNVDESELIKSLCEFVETDKVESIITYNYDDLMEMALEKRGKKRAVSIYSKSRNFRNEIPVYHVHGLIPKENQGMIPTPVLSEKEYHDIYRESFHWSNIEQLHALDRNTCFFFGLSMTDPNLRRLLDFSHTGSDNDPHHFAFLKRDNLYKEDDVDKNKRHFETLEQQLANVGVSVIWYENHGELPEIIRRIITPLRLVY